jgi:SsrA-binding protein
VKAKGTEKVVATNRKAFHDYDILERYEAGIVLQGTEVKSLRAGSVSMRDSYARVEGGEVFLYNLNIGTYDPAGPFNHDPLRKRKLLLHKSEINRLAGKVSEKGLTLIPLSIYFKGGKAKVELALARGKREYDKRERIREREMRREVQRMRKGEVW